MSMVLVGMSHHTTPVHVRETFAFSPEQIAVALRQLCRRVPDAEAMLLSTCNRTEVLLISETVRSPVEHIVRVLASVSGVPDDSFRHCLYDHADTEAVRHLFRVTSGLDSIALGEHHIVSQLKQAHALAREQGVAGRVLHRLVASALRTSARIRSETSIGLGKSTVPSVAVDMASTTVRDFRHKRVLVIGAGEMARSVCRLLRSMQARHIAVTSRTFAHARALAGICDARAVPFDRVTQELAKTDVVFTAMRCPTRILQLESMREIQQRRGPRPLLIVDLAVPRNVDAAVGDLDHLDLYNIDTLGRVVAENRAARERVVPRCEHVIHNQARRFMQWLTRDGHGAVLEQLYARAEQVRDAELGWLDDHGPPLSGPQRQAVMQMAHRLMKKLMHPVAAIGHCSDHGDAMHDMLRTLRDIASRHDADAPSMPSPPIGNDRGVITATPSPSPVLDAPDSMPREDIPAAEMAEEVEHAA